jgi:taurine dioxygenase
MFSVNPLSSALGAELSGVDLTTYMSSAVLQEIRQQLLEHEVIFFRDQDISPEQHRALAASFGPLQTHPAYDTVAGIPEITILESTAENPTKIEAWHTGGDTMWASMTAAYDALSPAMQQFLSTLNAEHDFSYGFKESLAEPGGRERLAQAVSDNPPVIHPVIRTHPETGKKVIFVNSLFTTRILELSREESQAVLNFLYGHITTPEFSCRFNWEPNSIAIWDNRSTQHKPVNDYFPAHRMLHRVVIDGDKPY